MCHRRLASALAPHHSLIAGKLPPPSANAGVSGTLVTRSSAARSTLKMLRVVLCIICLHPFLWLFSFALLYHTVKDFFVLILLKIDQFCMVLVFLDVLQDFNPLAVAGSQSAFAFAPLRFAACSTSWAGLAPALLANRAAPVGLLPTRS